MMVGDPVNGMDRIVAAHKTLGAAVSRSRAGCQPKFDMLWAWSPVPAALKQWAVEEWLPKLWHNP